jgi:multiple antibiotic resistance protein
MNFGAVDIFTILLITIGPLKGMIIFAALTARADAAFRRKVAMRAVATATGIVLLFIVAGELILQVFHVTLPALKIAGGIILLLVALHMVMGNMADEGKKRAPPASLPSASPSIRSRCRCWRRLKGSSPLSRSRQQQPPRSSS